MNINNKLKNLVDKYDIISFDIFDTLLKRNVRHPHDIFSIVEQEYNIESNFKISNFKENRIEAEHKARQISLKEDISLEEIYKQLPYEDYTKTKLKALELTCEIKFLTANQPFLELFNYAQSHNKKIVLVSDMYLSKEFISKQLNQLGYTNYYKLYVSSDYGLTKASGNLFRLILKDNGWKASKLLHIGDAKKADWIRPKLLGMHSYKISTYIKNTLYEDKKFFYDINYNILSSYINNNIALYSAGSRYAQIGYETLGPLLYGFCTWLHEQKNKLGLNKLLFFSRDGMIMQKAYNILFPEDDTEYVYVSRRSLLIPLFHTMQDIQEILSMIPFNRYISINTILEKLGLNHKDYKEKLLEQNFDPTLQYAQKEILSNKRFLDFLNQIKDDIKTNSLEEFKAFKQYINKLNINSSIGIIDIGWKGTMQFAFEKLMHQIGYNINIDGFYIGISKNEINMHGFIYNPIDKKLENTLRSFLGLFEMLFSADHGSVKKYYGNGNILYLDSEFNTNKETQESYKSIVEIQIGALNFIHSLHNSSIKKYIKWSNILSFKNISLLGTQPLKQDLRTISKWMFLDTTITPLAQPNIKSFNNIHNLKKDFSSSAWKIGYLKKLFRIPLPYLTLYSLIRNRVLRTKE